MGQRASSVVVRSEFSIVFEDRLKIACSKPVGLANWFVCTENSAKIYTLKLYKKSHIYYVTQL